MPAEPAPYVEVTVTVEPADAEAVAELLRSLADSGTWTEQPFAQPSLEEGAIPRDDMRASVHVYFRGADAAANAGLVRPAVRAAGIEGDVAARTVEASDWAEAWKEHFSVERFGERLVVVPSWRTYEPAPEDVVVHLDPGMAFGTGQHETTRMCLEALEHAVSAGDRVLDLGCGSGILSIAAARLGAREVVALDIDPDCVRITADNARGNGVDAVIRANHGTLPCPAADGPFHVVVANIISGVLIDLAVELAAVLAPGGILIASGVIGEREQAVRDAFELAGLGVLTARALGEWRCVEACKASGDA